MESDTSEKVSYLAWVNAGLYSDFDVVALEEPADLRQNGDGEDGDDDANEYRDCAQLTSRQRVTDVDVALDGQGHRQPDGRRVERCGDELGQTVVGETPRVRHPVTVAAERVEVDEARHRPYTCHGSYQFVFVIARPITESGQRGRNLGHATYFKVLGPHQYL